MNLVDNNINLKKRKFEESYNYYNNDYNNAHNENCVINPWQMHIQESFFVREKSQNVNPKKEYIINNNTNYIYELIQSVSKQFNNILQIDQFTENEYDITINISDYINKQTDDMMTD